jgi:hypothetical protein
MRFKHLRNRSVDARSSLLPLRHLTYRRQLAGGVGWHRLRHGSRADRYAAEFAAVYEEQTSVRWRWIHSTGLTVARMHNAPPLSTRTMPLRARSFVLALSLIFGAPLTATHAQSQDSTKAPARDSATAPRDTVYEVRLYDGSVLYGRIAERDSVHILVLTTGGTTVNIPSDRIRSLRASRGREVDGTYWPEDPNGTRLLFTSTGRALGRGEGYVSTYFLFFPFVAYGVTEKLTIAGGTPVFPGIVGQAFYLAPKLTLRETDKGSFAIGALSFGLTEKISEGTFGLLYGVSTLGNRDNAVTLGAGWGYRWGGENSSVSNAPVIVVGGEARVSRRSKFVTENWIFTSRGASGALMSGGFRFIGDRLSADFGVIGGAGSGAVACCLPMVNFVWNFGREGR